LGLWRAKFFENAAFYGGTALRILYGLNRFSEDLDFSLLKPQPGFSMDLYNTAVKNELSAYGLATDVTTKEKLNSNIVTAFIKSGTKLLFLSVDLPEIWINRLHHQNQIKVKMEIDIDPPQDFETESKLLLSPIPFSIRSYKPSFLFSGKVHALLCRAWQDRIKGRDWYDFAWYVARGIPLNLRHLKARLVQTGHWPVDLSLTKKAAQDLISARIAVVNFENAKKDVLPFMKNKQDLDAWSPQFFQALLREMILEE